MLPFCRARSLHKRIVIFLFLAQLLLCLQLEFGNLLAEAAYFSDLRITAAQQNRGDYVDRRLEFFALFVS